MRNEETYGVVLAFLYATTHQAPHECLQADDLRRLQGIPEGLIETDVACIDRGMWHAEDCRGELVDGIDVKG